MDKSEKLLMVARGVQTAYIEHVSNLQSWLLDNDFLDKWLESVKLSELQAANLIALGKVLIEHKEEKEVHEKIQDQLLDRNFQEP